MTRSVKAVAVLTLFLSILLASRPARAYSVLSHEANIDALWDSTIAPMLRARFPRTTPDQILEARGYAYGGCVIQDLGYYPFGSKFFSDLLHYVRTGDFIEALIRDAGDVNEYAFAVGALAHYSADNDGHSLAVNRVVPLMYPKLRREFGDKVTYEQSPKSHILVEFSFDVVQVASAAYAPEAYHRFIGFEVAKPVLERAFAETYGIQMSEVFLSEDVAISTYRHAVSVTIPEMTKVAWKKKRDEILRVTPTATRKDFVFELRRQEYEKEFGADYAKPHGFARVVGFLYTLISEIGPFRAFTFHVPTPEAERLFLASFTSTRDHYLQSLRELRAGRLRLANTNFDTGRVTRRGEYQRADDTYDELLGRLAGDTFAAMPRALRADIDAHYREESAVVPASRGQRRAQAKVAQELAELRATSRP